MRLDASHVHPFIGIPPHAVRDVELARPIDAVLTIEDLASFNRHAREARQPNVAVIYSGGFPARPVIETLRRLLDRSPDATLKHWGDIDAGGVRIFRNIEERLGRPASPIASLARIAEQDTGIADLALYLASGDPRHLEQEVIPLARWRDERRALS